ncbi:YeeE/YedE family protein [Bradyrhizobium sp. CCBAU 51765]|uniref:YeeE/YedE family protein n=1 Tax=Bradyrhizobium sp. CCBAU 51765 TaxID=1325102 RepID=UPI001888F005|nr:YeeE/YedE family protein [Bradyrhizobium sp. CCBAU 51765]QOZ11020.1 YeeE/YedE family protein [Bradyrhizobium sp. CCBAU 51765]
MEAAQFVILAGLVIGLVYGAVGLLSGFCLMSSMRGLLAEGDGRLVRSYALAIAVAIAASQLLAGNGMVDLGKSIYLQQSFSVPVLFLGGLLFGYGMVLSNGCGSRALVLLGRGNLRSFVVVIVLAIAAQMTLKGLIAPARIALVQASQTTVSANSLPSVLVMLGVTESLSRALAAAATVVGLMLFAFAHPAFRRSPGQISAGVVVGLLVAGGWYVTDCLGADDFNPVPVTSLTFIAPIADTLQYAMLSTGLTLNFGIATVAGVFAGSLVTALATGRFKLEGYSSPRHMLRSGSGAALMGIGGVMAFGCSIGQGLTGVSTLALGSFVALAGILVGTTAGLRGALRVQPLAVA